MNTLQAVDEIISEEDPRLIEAHFQNGQINLVYEYPSLAILASELGRYITEQGGLNYVQARLFDQERNQAYLITVQPDQKPMPSDIVATYRDTLTAILRGSTDDFAIQQAKAALTQFGHLA